MHVYVYICIYTHYIYAYNVYTHAYAYMHTYTHIGVEECMEGWLMDASMHQINILVHVNDAGAYVHACMSVCVFIYTYVYASDRYIGTC